MPSPAPLYEHVKRYLTDRITTGEFGPGEKLPSESEIVQTLSVSRMTANRALRELALEGVIVRVQGVGSFVNEPKTKASILEVRDIHDMVLERHGVHRRKLVLAQEEALYGEIADLFGREAGSAVSHVLVAHFDRDTPLQLERRFVLSEFAPGLLSLDFERRSIFDYLQAIAPVSELEHIVEASRPDEIEREELHLGRDSPVLRIRRRTWVGSSVVTLSYFSHPCDTYRVVARVKAGQSEPDFGNIRVAG